MSHKRAKRHRKFAAASAVRMGVVDPADFPDRASRRRAMRLAVSRVLSVWRQRGRAR